MIVYAGDWIKYMGQWYQVVGIKAGDLFGVIDSDGYVMWLGTENPELYDGHLSNLEMQEKLEGVL